MGLGIWSGGSRRWRCGSGWPWGWFEDGDGELCGVSMVLEEMHFYSTGKVFDVGPEWEYWTMWWKWGENGDDGCLRRVFGCEIGHGVFTFENVRTCRSFLLKIIFGNLKEKQFLKTKHTKFVCTDKKKNNFILQFSGSNSTTTTTPMHPMTTAKAPAIVNKPTSAPMMLKNLERTKRAENPINQTEPSHQNFPLPNTTTLDPRGQVMPSSTRLCLRSNEFPCPISPKTTWSRPITRRNSLSLLRSSQDGTI